MNKRQTHLPSAALRSLKLKELYVELDAVEVARDRAFGVAEHASLSKRRGELLGQIKKLEREYNERKNDSD